MNLYHSIDNESYLNSCKWLNLHKLCNLFVPGLPPENIFYFTTKVTWDTAKANKHQILIDVYNDMGINVIPGEFKITKKKCRATCKREYSFHVEKKTDVNIGINIVSKALLNEFDSVYLMSGDNDLLPALQFVKLHCPEKKLGVIKPMGMRAEEMKLLVDNFKKIRGRQLLTCILDNPFRMSTGVVKRCPPSWS